MCSSVYAYRSNYPPLQLRRRRFVAVSFLSPLNEDFQTDESFSIRGFVLFDSLAFLPVLLAIATSCVRFGEPVLLPFPP